MAPSELFLALAVRFFNRFWRQLGFLSERQYAQALELNPRRVKKHIRDAIKRLEQGKEAA